MAIARLSASSSLIESLKLRNSGFSRKEEDAEAEEIEGEGGTPLLSDFRGLASRLTTEK